MNFDGKIALVTGGAGGIGFAITEELLRNGIKHVAILDLKTSSGKESAEKLNGEFGKGRAIFIICDVTEASEFEAAFAKTIEEFGGLDIVINNAGIASEKRWELTINVNLNGVTRGTYLALEYMGKHKGGNGGLILNIASIFGLDSVPWSPTYVATKHAIIGLGKSFGAPYNYEKTGVRVVTICPGVTETKLVAEGCSEVLNLVDPEAVKANIEALAFQKPESVARGVMHLLKSAKSGSIWVIEGGEPAFEISILDRFALKAVSK